MTVTGNWTRLSALNKMLGAGLPQLSSCEVPLSCRGCAEPGGWKITHLLCSVKNNEIFSGPWRVRTSWHPGGYGPSCRGRDLAPACESQSKVALQERGVRRSETSPSLPCRRETEPSPNAQCSTGAQPWGLR